MNKEDVEFLQELQNELNTQSGCGQADPYYWGIMERKTVPAFEDCGDEIRWVIVDVCDGDFTTEEFIEYIKENYYDEFTDEQKEEWDEYTEDGNPSPWGIKYFLEHNGIIDNVSYYEVEEKDVLSQETGCFLTRRAAREYINRFGYNHSQPRTYAMTAYRNFELERLLKILKTADFSKLLD